jgi:hypoxanthine-guanine phosphoribosyltransferase
MAADIECDYQDPLDVVSVLKGVFNFFADLTRAFMAISSCGNQKSSSGQVKLQAIWTSVLKATLC